jgi:hypothetical protein
MSDEQFVQRVQQVDEEGKQRFGDDWGQYVTAIGRANPGGIAPEAWRQVLTTPDPAAIIAQGGKEALVNLSDAGDKEAEYAYNEIRQRERKHYRLMRGRGPG